MASWGKKGHFERCCRSRISKVSGAPPVIGVDGVHIRKKKKETLTIRFIVGLYLLSAVNQGALV